MMIHICLLVILYQFISLIQSTHSWNKPMIFNPYTLEPYDVGIASMTYKGGPYAVACPATGQHEQDFNKPFSLDHKALFLRHFSNKETDEIYRIRCDNSVELAAAYYTDRKTKQKYLKFGYEVYFVKSKYQEPFNESLPYSDFKKVLKPVKESVKHFFSGSPQTPFLAEEGSKDLLEMGFMWISKATLKFDVFKWKAVDLSYSIHKKVDPPAEKCDDYELLNKLLGKMSIDYFYMPDHQEKIFNSVKLPVNDCESKNNCIMKYSLVPAYQFQTSNTVSCTNLTTVPVWSETTVPLLDHLDKFLFAIAQVTDKKLTIYPSTDETLVLPTIDDYEREFKFMYLYPEKKKLAIPKIIIKLVVYQTHSCDRSIALCWFQAIIVVHNEPKINHKLCKEDKCKLWGWESIQYPDKNNPQEKSELIYCCEMDEDLQEILMGSSEEIFIYRNLNLQKFPRFNRATKKHEYENKLERIKDKMNQLFGDGESSDPANSWTPLPSLQNVELINL